MIRTTCIQLFCLIILLLPQTLPAAERPAAEGMLIRADRMNHDAGGDLLVATGSVEMTWQDLTMTADWATYNRETRILHAEGNVYLVKGGDIMWGDRLVLDSDTGRAEMENGRLFMTQGNFYANGKQIARKSEDSYALNQGSLTTCDTSQTSPSWKFGASNLDVTVEEFAQGTNVIFYVKDIPVFYFPYLILPVKKERQSGLLFPRFGSSSKRGVFIDIPYYWAISPSQEATFDLDIQTKRGVGLGADYRYLRSRTSTGSVGGYIIHDNNEKKVRGQLVQFHTEQLPNDLSLITSINLTSDRTFLADYADKSGEYNRQYYDSRVVLTKSWQSWLTSAQAIYTQDFYAGSNTTTLQRAPELSLYGVREKLPFMPVSLDLDLILTNYYREKGMQGQRMLLTPRLVTNQPLFDGRLNLRLQAGVQMRGYNTTEADPGIREKTSVVLPELSGELGSSFSRVFDTEIGSFSRLRHELAPSLGYSYLGKKDQSVYPLYDQNDRAPHLNMLTFALASNLGGKLKRVEGDTGPERYRHLQTVRLSQSYSLSGTRPNLINQDDGQHPWGDTLLESETWVLPSLRMLLDAGYNHYRKRVSSSALGAEYNDSVGNSAAVSYRLTDRSVEYLEARAALAIFKPVYLSYTGRYSFDKQDFLENFYSLEYRHQCWSVIATYRERPNDRAWTINFNLAGLFNIGTNSMGGGR